MLVEEPNPTQGNQPSASGGFLYIRQVQEVLAQFFFIDLIWWLLAEFGKLAHWANIPAGSFSIDLAAAYLQSFVLLNMSRLYLLQN